MIEAASRFHAGALAAIHAAAFPPGARWGADAMALQLEQPGGYGLVDAAGGFVLARVTVDEAELLTLAVAPAARRGGLGRALLAAAMDEAGRRGAGSMVLEVAEANDVARRLYARAGFARVGLRRDYYGVSSDAEILRAVIAFRD